MLLVLPESQPAPRPASFFKTPAARSAGFSLIEIVLALGIIVFALVPMLGLVANGLSTVRSSIDFSITSDIVREVKARMNKETSATLSALQNNQVPTTLYFDNHGTALASRATSVYQAEISVPYHPSKGIFSGQDIGLHLFQVDIKAMYAPGGVSNKTTGISKSTLLITPID